MKKVAKNPRGIGRELCPIQRSIHQLHPAIARGLIKLEWHVAHAEARMAARFFIPTRPAEAADEKIAEPLFGAGQVFLRIHRPENVVAGHLRVERRHQSLKAVFADPRVDVAFGHHFNHGSINHMIADMTDEAPKSALELAMERLRKKDAEQGVSDRPLTEEQKNEIAEVRKTYSAKLAQEEILFKSTLAGVLEYEARQTLQDNYRRDVDRLTHERDRKIEKIRSA
jgi:hypothetical protein